MKDRKALGSLKGSLGSALSKPPEAFGQRSRDWSLGHAGDEGPHLAMTGESRGCSRTVHVVTKSGTHLSD